MEDNSDTENPLQSTKSDNVRKYTGNNPGRPQRNKEIKFTSPPKSMMSIILSKEKSINKTSPVATQSSRSIECQKWICRYCLHRSDNRHEHIEHLMQHKNQLLSCDYSNCTYSTTSSSNLIKHRRAHTSEKPYICDKCTFRTNFKNSLTVHQRIHTSERPYACKLCDYKCNSSSNLKKHCNHRHVTEKQRAIVEDA